MSPNSLHYQFDPTSVGWLRRKVKSKDVLTAGDLVRIGNADPSAFGDPVFKEQILLAAEQRLPRRFGRPPEDPMMWWKTVMADVLVEDRAAEIRAERNGSRTRGSLEPRVQAAEEVARELWMHIGAEGLCQTKCTAP